VIMRWLKSVIEKLPQLLLAAVVAILITWAIDWWRVKTGQGPRWK